MYTIIGARGTIESVEEIITRIFELSEKYNCIIQLMDADYVYGKIHIISAIEHAQRAFTQKTNSLNNLSLEILLYVSGERQITKAIQKVGLKTKTKRIALIVILNDNTQLSHKIIEKIMSICGFVQDDKVLEGDRDTLQRFGITSEELETMSPDRYGDIILEKVALVDIIK